MKVNIKKIDERAIIPTYGSAYSAGADIYALTDADIVISPGETVLIHTGISLEIPEGYGGFVYARSGLSTKRGLAPANKVGVIDADYRGELMVPIYNQSSTSQTISCGDRVAQLVVAPFLKCEFETVAELNSTNRGSDGFGSTGK